MPLACPPTAEALRTQPCPACGHVNWAPLADAAAEQCRVFLPAAVRWTNFPSHKCLTLDCNGTLSADGREYFLLRCSECLAFGLELLYQFSRKLDDTASPFSTHFKDSIASTLTYDLSSVVHKTHDECSSHRSQYLKCIFMSMMHMRLSFFQSLQAP